MMLFLRAGVCLVVCAILIPFAVGVRQDNSLEIWLDAKGGEAESFREFQRDFKDSEFIIAAIDLGREYQPGDMDNLNATAAQIRAEMDGSVSSLADFRQTGTPFDEWAEQISKLRAFEGTFVNKDGSVLSIRYSLTPEDKHNRGYVVDQFRKIVLADWDNIADVHFGGPPLFNVEMDRMATASLKSYFPWIAILVTVSTVVLLRSWPLITATILFIGMSVGCTLGWAGLLYGSLNLVTGALAPLMVVLALSFALHVCHDYRQRVDPGTGRSISVSSTFRALRRPLLCATGTTAAGFLSLALCDSAAVRELGVSAAAGIGTMTLAGFWLLPGILILLPSPGQPKPRHEEGSTQPFAYLRWMESARSPVFLGAALTCTLILVGVGLIRLHADSNALRFFPDDSAIVKDYHFMETNLLGLSPAEYLLKPASGAISASFLHSITRSEEAVEKTPDVKGVLSLPDLVEAAGFTMTGRLMPIDAVLPFIDWNNPPKEIRHYYDPHSGLIRLTAHFLTTGSSRYQSLQAEAKELIESELGSIEVQTTGLVPRIVNMQRQLVHDQLRGFGFAFIGVFGVLFAWMRSVRLTAVAVLPNILPAAGVLALMGAVDIPLDTATITVASIALGIAVDDTAHLLSRYDDGKRAGLRARDAIESALRHCIKPVVATSVIASLGFLILATSGFLPLRAFGGMLAVSMMLALAGDLILLPWLLLVLDRRRAHA